jgi:ankyrin repeat protein
VTLGSCLQDQDMPLILKAAYFGEIDTITDLIKGKGMDPRLTNSEGTQAIHIAAREGHLHIVKALVEHHGVPPDARNNVRSGSNNFAVAIPFFCTGSTSTPSHGSMLWPRGCS